MENNERSAHDPVHDKAAEQPFNAEGGEDEGSTSQNGSEAHLNDDQKSPASFEPDSVDADDPHKVEKLTKAGRPIDLDEAEE